METVYSLEQQIAGVERAIQAILLGAQSYRLGEDSVTRADLSALKALRKDLLAEKAASRARDALTGAYRAKFEGR